MFKNLEMGQFRSHTKSRFEFVSGTNILIGKNGSGKTNLLEALYILATGKSFRSKDQNLIQNNQTWAKLQAELNGQNRVLTIKNNQELIEKQFVINNQTYKRIPNKLKQAVCLFEPSHLQALYAGPDLRRALLDQILTQTTPEYNKALAGFKRALLQRNNLLKSKRQIKLDEFFIWDVRLSEFSQILVDKRQALIDNFNQSISVKYSQIADEKHKARLKYKTGSQPEKYGSWLLARLQQTLSRDKQTGFTTNGPHRDDLVFYLDNDEVSVLASRGEIRSLLLTYKLLELAFLEQQTNQKPIIMFDDVFSELDETRQQKLLASISGYQAFITTTHKPSKYATTTNTIKLK